MHGNAKCKYSGFVDLDLRLLISLREDGLSVRYLALRRGFANAASGERGPLRSIFQSRKMLL